MAQFIATVLFFEHKWLMQQTKKYFIMIGLPKCR